MGRQTNDKAVSPRTETSYKAACADESAPHDEVQGSALKVNDEVVQLEFAFLSGEICAAFGRPLRKNAPACGQAGAFTKMRQRR